MPNSLKLTFQGFGTVPAFTVDVASVSFDMVQTLNIGSTASGAGAGKVAFNPFTFTRKPDVHSPELWNRLCSGTPFMRVSLAVTTSTSAGPFLTLTMGLVAIKTVAFSASETDASFLEVVTLEYGQAAYSVTPQNPDGSFGKAVAAGWDRVKNVGEDPAKVGFL